MEEGEIERFRLEVREDLSPTSLRVRPGNVLVAVHDPNSLRHLQKVLGDIKPEKVDVVALSVNVSVPEKSRDLERQAEQVVDNYESLVFSRVVHVAEKAGKAVFLVAIAGKEPYPPTPLFPDSYRPFIGGQRQRPGAGNTPCLGAVAGPATAGHIGDRTGG
jgi:hypothetical protein